MVHFLKKSRQVVPNAQNFGEDASRVSCGQSEAQSSNGFQKSKPMMYLLPIRPSNRHYLSGHQNSVFLKTVDVVYINDVRATYA